MTLCDLIVVGLACCSLRSVYLPSEITRGEVTDPVIFRATCNFHIHFIAWSWSKRKPGGSLQTQATKCEDVAVQAGLHVSVSLPRCLWADHNFVPHCEPNKSVLALGRLYQELCMLVQGVNVPFSLPFAFSWCSCATNRAFVTQE